MAFQISGIIQHIGNTESIPYQDKVFKKRELVLDCSYRNQFTGQIERANYPKFEFTGNHVDDLNDFNIGDIVTVSFSLNGSRSGKMGKSDTSLTFKVIKSRNINLVIISNKVEIRPHKRLTEISQHLHKGHAKAHNKQLWSLQEMQQHLRLLIFLPL